MSWRHFDISANYFFFLNFISGPYSGRSPDIIPKLGGVLLNPNCEYGANFVPIHTLAQWSRCSVDGTMLNQNDTISGKLIF
jgi:protein O-GlcNAcase/histone acetyltransferase